MTPEWEQDAREAEYAAERADAPHGRCILCEEPLTGEEDTEAKGPDGGYWFICAACAAE